MPKKPNEPVGDDEIRASILMPRALHKEAVKRAKALGYGARPLSPYVRTLIEFDLGLATTPPPAIGHLHDLRRQQAAGQFVPPENPTDVLKQIQDEQERAQRQAEQNPRPPRSGGGSSSR